MKVGVVLPIGENDYAGGGGRPDAGGRIVARRQVGRQGLTRLALVPRR
jgi:hypothetical protein